ncbi:MAG: hypothetical protein IPK93_02345 [Solirubrobacterales bacterium]|nr:hypothetical protein [Solirubrobacterales bacterium]
MRMRSLRSLVVAMIAAGLLVGGGPADAKQTRGDLATKPKVLRIELVCDSTGRHRGRVNLAVRVAYPDVKSGRERRYRNFDRRVRAGITVRRRSSGRVLARIRDRDRSYLAVPGYSVRHWHSRLLGRKASRRILRASRGTSRCRNASGVKRHIKVKVHAVGRLRKPGARKATALSRQVTAERRVAVQAAASTPCDMTGRSTVQALTQCRGWVTYAPASLDDNVSDKQLRRDLNFLQGQGFRGIVTYTVAGNMDHAPGIAKSVGFQKVIAGVWDPGNLPPAPGANSEMQKLNALLEKPSGTVDGVVLGNEGIARQNFGGASPKWTLQDIQDWVSEFKQAYPRIPVTTSDVWIMYGPPGTIAKQSAARRGRLRFPKHASLLGQQSGEQRTVQRESQLRRRVRLIEHPAVVQQHRRPDGAARVLVAERRRLPGGLP